MQQDDIVTVKGPSAQQHDARPGESIVFGSCACSDCAVQIKVAPGRGQWLRGVLHVRSDHWRLDNLSPDVDFVSHDLEDRRQSVRIRASRVDVVVPFELAVVRFGPDGEELLVFGHEPQVRPPLPCAREARDAQRVRLAPGTVYMAVLEELCRLRGGGSGLPTSAQIAAALGARGVATSSRAVDRHIDYLYGRFYPEDEERAAAHRPGWKRRAVASAGSRALRCVPVSTSAEPRPQQQGC